MSETIRIYVTCDRHGQRGPLYTARLGNPDGEVLVSGTTEPALDAARVLTARGCDPAAVLEMWDSERHYPRLTGQLGRMAGQTVKESEKGNRPAFGKYVPFQNAVSPLPVSPKTGVQPVSGTDIAPDKDGAVRHDVCKPRGGSS